MPRVVVIGDDLTGSNATGARFARTGMRTISVSGTDRVSCAGAADVLVLNVGTRHCAPRRARELVQQAVRSARALSTVDLIAKRVDTTLRGNVGAEVDALLEVAEPGTRALVVPAFPEAGRTTVGGIHLVDGVPLAETSAAQDPLTPVGHSRVATVLRHGTGRAVREVPLDVVQAGVLPLAESLAADDAPLVVVDATSSAHLGTIAEAAARVRAEHGTSWVSVDSGPFAVRLARALDIDSGAGSPGPGVPPVLVVAGSITDTTREQLVALEQETRARFVDVAVNELDARAIADRAAGLVRSGSGVVGIRTRLPASDRPVDAATAEHIPVALAEATAILLREHCFGGLYVTGGDIAEATTAALEGDGFAIDTEVLPLAVAGTLVGGVHDGLPFATKGGLIGDRYAAVACVEHLNRVATQQLAARRAIP